MIFQPWKSAELQSGFVTPLSTRQNIRGQTGVRIWNYSPWAWDVLGEGDANRPQGFVPAWTYVQMPFESLDMLEVVIAMATDLPVRIISGIPTWRFEVQFIDDDQVDVDMAAIASVVDIENTIINASSGNVANATATATLAATPSTFTFINGFEITGAGATAAAVVVATVTGVTGGPLSYVIAVPAGVTVGIAPLVVEFTAPIKATAFNTPIVVSMPAFGAGNTNAAIAAHGFQA